MKTKQLFLDNPYELSFVATVLENKQFENGIGVLLDATAFCPTMGGQFCDKGLLAGMPVMSVEIDKEGKIYHIIESPLPLGDQVIGEVQYTYRMHNMQNHSGEHILSGIVHSLYGFDNVGFHLGEDVVTVDFNGVFPNDDTSLVEKLANDAILRNIPIETFFPSKEEIPNLIYRSKMEITEDLRLVKIGDIDTCACCAPHVSSTGEVQMLKILSLQHHRGGTRLTLVCGEDARRIFQDLISTANSISKTLSLPMQDIATGVINLQNTYLETKSLLFQEKLKSVQKELDGYPYSQNALLFVTENDDMRILREYAVKGASKSDKFALAIAKAQDPTQYHYAVASEQMEIKDILQSLNKALNGNGGGKNGFGNGVLRSSLSDIQAFIKTY